MQFKKWKNLTKKRGYFRSNDLKHVDTALYNYQHGTGTIGQLKTAYNTWIATKPNQGVQTIRNRRLDQQGLGPVERLSRYIHNEEGTHVATQGGVTFDNDSQVYLTDDDGYSEANRKVVFETISIVKGAIGAARESFQGGGFLSRTDFDGVYQMWFGARDAGREKQVKDKYNRLKAVICDKAVNVHDAAGGSDFGYSYRGHNDVANIWVEDGFWDISSDVRQRFASAMDARVVTALHEFAHGILDAADEHLNDGTLCNDADSDRLLAQESPEKALNNADNVAQYAMDCLLIKTGNGRIP